MKFWFIGVAGCVALSACAPTTRFEWGGYEAGLYNYYRDAANGPQYQTALENAIERGQATDRVAPGLHAELGYILWEQGRYDEARTHFERERELFPESAVFMDRYLGNAGANTGAPAAEVAAPAPSAELNS